MTLKLVTELVTLLCCLPKYYKTTVSGLSWCAVVFRAYHVSVQRKLMHKRKLMVTVLYNIFEMHDFVVSQIFLISQKFRTTLYRYFEAANKLQDLCCPVLRLASSYQSIKCGGEKERGPGSTTIPSTDQS